MTCEEIQKHAITLLGDLSWGFNENPLKEDPERDETVLAHMESCERCQKAMDEDPAQSNVTDEPRYKPAPPWRKANQKASFLALNALIKSSRKNADRWALIIPGCIIISTSIFFHKGYSLLSPTLYGLAAATLLLSFWANRSPKRVMISGLLLSALLPLMSNGQWSDGTIAANPCLAMGILATIIPLLAALFIAHRGCLDQQSDHYLAAVGIFAALGGQILMSGLCPNKTTGHILLGHLTAILLCAIVGLAAAKWVYRKI